MSNAMVESLLFDYSNAHKRSIRIKNEINGINRKFRIEKIHDHKDKARFLFLSPFFSFFFILVFQTQSLEALFPFFNEELMTSVAFKNTFNQAINSSLLAFLLLGVFYNFMENELKKELIKYTNFDVKIFEKNHIRINIHFLTLVAFFVAITSNIEINTTSFSVATILIGFIAFSHFFAIHYFSEKRLNNKALPANYGENLETLKNEEKEAFKHFSFLKNKVLETEAAMKIVVEKIQPESFKFKDEYESYKVLIDGLEELKIKLEKNRKKEAEIKATFDIVYKNEREHINKVLIENE